MPDKKQPFVVAKVRALSPANWLGSAGERFRQTVRTIATALHLKERAKEAPDLAWVAVEGAATEKHSSALLNYAKKETELIEVEFKRETLKSRIRQEHATADKLEAEARIAQVNEASARVELYEKLRAIGVRPVWEESGKMTFVNAPPDLSWDEGRSALSSDAAKKIGSGE